MIIRQLDLLAFGPFTDVSLSFKNAKHGLHIVCGPNEAGKSSALRALRQLLFGIPHNSRDNFLHPNQNIRIGARLENADGEPLECIRRKGRNNTLRGPDDAEVVDPTRLLDMFGGIDEATFSQRFGIDYEELRHGGQAVAQGGGDLGDILFAAGAGVADLGQVQKRLADEADELFKPRGSNQRINKAISELREARRQIKDSQLLTSDWVKHDKALRQATQRQIEIDEQLLKQKSEKSRLERIDEALPLIARRKQLREQLADVADAALLPDDFSGNRRESVTELKTTQLALANAEEAIAKLQAAMEELKVPEELLAHRTAITRLHTELGSFQKAAKDRPGLVARLQQAEQQAQTILLELDREPDLDKADQLRIKRAQRQKIQSLAGDCKALMGKKETAAKSVRDLHGEIEQIESQLAETTDPADPAELERAIRRVQKHGDLDQRLDEARGSLRELQRQAEIDLQKLRLWDGTLEDLERLPVPALPTIERFENELADANSAVGTIQQRIDEAKAKIQQLDQKLEGLRLEQDVPSEDDLQHARQQRDAGWQLVLRAWRKDSAADDSETAEFIAQFASGGDLAQAYQASVDAADQIGDRLRREADRVAEKAKLTADRQDLERRLEVQLGELEGAQDNLKQLQSGWRDEWSSLNIDPLSPREMRSWLNQQAALGDTAATLRKQRDTVDSLDGLIRSQRMELGDCLAALGHPTATDDESLAVLLGRCESVADEIESTVRQTQELKRNLQRLREKLKETERDAEQASRAMDKWETEWAAAVEQLGLDRNAEPLTATSVIESVDKLLEHVKDAGEIRARVEGIDRDANTFTESVTHLLSQVAPDLLDIPVDQAVADLNDRLEIASTGQTKLDGWQEQLQHEVSKRNSADTQVQRWQTTIETMCQEAGCDTPDELPNAERRSAARKDLENELSLVDEQLGSLAGNSSLDDFMTEAMQQDADQVKAMIDRLQDEIVQLENEKSAVSETIGSERTELRRMDGSGQAAEAQEQAEHLLARIRGDAEQYIRIRLASAVLRKSIERFREQSQGPVMQRASELFGELTLGSFEGLRADYDDKGNAVLVGVRSDGQRTVGVEGMSDGTCDQLYLSLRLALLESYLAHREPIPFIVDDILIMFDDDRAVAALKALLCLAEQTQVIFFTHHHHLVQLARENLDDNLFIHDFHYREPALQRSERVEN